MKIITDNNLSETELIEIKSASYSGDYLITIVFNDGVEKSIDFKSFLLKSLHPSIKKYLDQDLFMRFDIIDGNLNWNDFDLIFPVNDLYEDNIR